MASKPKMWEKLTPSDVRRLVKKLPGKRKEFEAGFVELEPPHPSEGAYSDDDDKKGKKNNLTDKTTFVGWLLYVYDGHNGHIRKLVRDLESSTDRPSEEDYFTIYTWLKKVKKADPFILEACELAHQIFDQALRDPLSFSSSSSSSSFSSSFSSSSSSSSSTISQSLMDTKHAKEDKTIAPSPAKKKDMTTKAENTTTKDDKTKRDTSTTDDKKERKQKDIYTIQSFVIPADLTKTNHEWLSTLVLSEFMTVAQDNHKKKFDDFHKWLSALSLGNQDWSLLSDTKSDGRHHVVVRLKNYNLYCDQTGQKSHLYQFKINGLKEWSLASFEQLMKETGTKFFHSSSDKGIQWASTIVTTKFVAEWAKHQQTKFAPTGQEKPTLRMEDVDLPFVIDLTSDWSQHPKYKQNLLKPNQNYIVGFARYGVSTNQLLKFTAAIEQMGYRVSKQ